MRLKGGFVTHAFAYLAASDSCSSSKIIIVSTMLLLIIAIGEQGATFPLEKTEKIDLAASLTERGWVEEEPF